MAVIAANITEDTIGLLDHVLESDKFERFMRVNKLDLTDRTLLIRLALLNLIQHMPAPEEVSKYKAALRLPTEFDDYLESKGRGR